MINKETLKNQYTKIITDIHEVSNTWVSGKGYPIVKMIRNSGLLLNNKYTKNFINNLVKNDIIKIKSNDKDYIYHWTGTHDIEEAVELMMKELVIDQRFKKDMNIFIMYNNKLHEGKIVEVNFDSVIVAVNTVEGLKSMTLDQKGLESLSASFSYDEIINKLEASLRKY